VKCRSRLARSAARSAAAAPARASTTKSNDGRSRWRKDSRASRFSVLRSTARFAVRRETVRPSRAMGRPLGLARTVKYRSPERSGSANTRPNSAALCNRCSGEKPAVPVRNAAPKRQPLRCQARTALGAAARENLAARGRCHARAEPVGAFAVQVARLKSSFHARLPRESKSSRENKRMSGNWEAAHCTRRELRLSTVKKILRHRDGCG
jgi:hypothetical protein